jgi:NAD(P)-dependent dehydrogenase (short-subunit alcohol dehydrogenase family)
MQVEPAGDEGKVAIGSGGSGATGRTSLDAVEHPGVRAISLDLAEPGAKCRWVKCDVRGADSVQAVNLRGAYFLIRNALPLLRKGQVRARSRGRFFASTKDSISAEIDLAAA